MMTAALLACNMLAMVVVVVVAMVVVTKGGRGGVLHITCTRIGIGVR